MLSAMFLESKHIDGIIYTSVQAEGSPVIAIKPTSVSKKIEHLYAESYMIEENYGYANYRAKKIYEGKIEARGTIIWNFTT